MNIVNGLNSNALTHALGWTICHSIWQIALIALLLFLILTLAGKYSSKANYYLGTGTLCISLLISAITFCREYNEFSYTLTEIKILNQENSDISLYTKQVSTKSTEISLSLTDKLKSFVNRNLSIAVISWNICVFILLVRLIGGVLYSQSLRKRNTFPISDEWQNLLNRLSDSLGIRKKIRLLHSTMVQTPVVIGHFKPVILLPVSILTGLNPCETEAILMHELAHIKRNDYLINLFISLIEIIFFYHPAIWWISNMIKKERENTCDDIAVSNNIKHQDLAKALARMELIKNREKNMVMAFIGNKKTVLKRIRRMTTKHSTKFTLKECLLSTGILLGCFLIMAFSPGNITNKTNNYSRTTKPEQSYFSNQLKTIGNTVYSSYLKDSQSKDTIISFKSDNEIKYQVNKTIYNLYLDDNEKLVKLTVDRNEIPKDKWNLYQKTIDEVLRYKQSWEKEKVSESEFEEGTDIETIDELIIDEMKKDNLIDGNSTDIIVQSDDFHLEINGKKQEDDVFQKYKDLYQEKKGGKFNLDIHYKNNKNLIQDNNEDIQLAMEEELEEQNEILDEQKELLTNQEKVFREDEREFREEERILRDKEKNLKDIEYPDLKMREERLKNKESKDLLKRELELRNRKLELKQEQELKDQELQLKKQELELKKQEMEVRKMQILLNKKNLEIKKLQYEIRKEDKRLNSTDNDEDESLEEINSQDSNDEMEVIEEDSDD